MDQKQINRRFSGVLFLLAGITFIATYLVTKHPAYIAIGAAFIAIGGAFLARSRNSPAA